MFVRQNIVTYAERKRQQAGSAHSMIPPLQTDSNKAFKNSSNVASNSK